MKALGRRQSSRHLKWAGLVWVSDDNWIFFPSLYSHEHSRSCGPKAGSCCEGDGLAWGTRVPAGGLHTVARAVALGFSRCTILSPSAGL